MCKKCSSAAGPGSARGGGKRRSRGKTVRPLFSTFALVVVLSLPFVLCGAVRMDSIKEITIGVATSTTREGDAHVVVLDNGTSYTVPLGHPVPDIYIGTTIHFPYFNNTGLALVRYADGRSGWLNARVAVGMKGILNMGDARYAFHELTYEQCVALAPQAEAGDWPTHYGMLSILPVPSFYWLHFDDQFAKHNYTVIQKALADPGQDVLVDIAYKHAEGVGYTIVYVQPTRFSREYCEQAGIKTK